MDIWEANGQAQAFTPHPCNVTGVYKCKGALCGSPDRYGSVCDKDGCDFNPYRLGQLDYYRPLANATVDTTRPFTVVTQFLTTTGDGKGDLREIRRLYLQDGELIENSLVQAAGFNKGNSMTDEFCAQEKKVFGGVDAFKNQGGMKGMGEAFRRGMVLAMSIWDDAGSAMKWLDGTYPPDKDPKKDPGTGRGPCGPNEGAAASLLAGSPWVQVKFSNIRRGEIGSTYKAGGDGPKCMA
jgi:cellulose 1,4-beta-cellobiosidase